MEYPEESAARAARNQGLFRGVNEKIEEINEAFMVVLERMDFVCECADDSCMERIPVRLEQYEAVRSRPTHFIVKEGHTYPAFERVVEVHEDFVVVEKFGKAARIAKQLNPRREKLRLQT